MTNEQLEKGCWRIAALFIIIGIGIGIGIAYLIDYLWKN